MNLNGLNFCSRIHGIDDRWHRWVVLKYLRKIYPKHIEMATNMETINCRNGFPRPISTASYQNHSSYSTGAGYLIISSLPNMTEKIIFALIGCERKTLWLIFNLHRRSPISFLEPSLPLSSGARTGSAGR